MSSEPIPPRTLPLARALLAAAVAVHLLFLVNLGLSWRAYQRTKAPVGLDRLFSDPMHTLGIGADFFQFYQSGYDARRGWSVYTGPRDNPRSPEDPVGVVVPHMYANHYPPVVAYAIGAPLTLLQPWLAYWAWVAVMVALTWTAAVWSYRLADSSSVGCLAAAMWFAYSPWYVDVYMGQINILMAVGIFALVRAFERDRYWRAALVYAAITVVKLFPLLYGAVLVRFARWRALLVCGAALLLSMAPYFLAHPDDWRYFIQWAANPDISPLALTSGNLGLKVLLYQATSSQTLPRMTGLLFLGAGVMITFFSRSRDLRHYIGLWTCTFFFVQTFVWEHHYVILVPVIVLCYVREPNRRLLAIWVWLALPTLFILFDMPEVGRRLTPIDRWSQWQRVTYHLWKLIPVFALYGHCVGGCPSDFNSDRTSSGTDRSQTASSGDH